MSTPRPAAARQLIRVQWLWELHQKDVQGILRLVALRDPDLFDEMAAEFLRCEPPVAPREPGKVIEMLRLIGPDTD